MRCGCGVARRCKSLRVLFRSPRGLGLQVMRERDACVMDEAGRGGRKKRLTRKNVMMTIDSKVGGGGNVTPSAS